MAGLYFVIWGPVAVGDCVVGVFFVVVAGAGDVDVVGGGDFWDFVAVVDCCVVDSVAGRAPVFAVCGSFGDDLVVACFSAVAGSYTSDGVDFDVASLLPGFGFEFGCLRLLCCCGGLWLRFRVCCGGIL